jgi:hypothetical protein
MTAPAAPCIGLSRLCGHRCSVEQNNALAPVAGYSLDATHAPHVSMLQRFVRATDLDAVTATVARVLAAERPTDLQLTVKGID